MVFLTEVLEPYLSSIGRYFWMNSEKVDKSPLQKSQRILRSSAMTKYSKEADSVIVL